MLVDVHAHLDDAQFEKDLPEVIKRAEKNEVKIIISAGIDQKSNRNTLKIAQEYPIVKSALGIYPSTAITLSHEEINNELDFIRKRKITAISEIGLDNTYPNLKKQKEVFVECIKIAEKKNIPLIIHSRKAEQETIETLQTSKSKKIVMHCFCGNKKQIKVIEDQGWYFSIPPSIVRSEHFKFLVDKVSISQLLTESDAPYLSPVKEQRNEPAFVQEAIKEIAEKKQITVEETEKIIFMNLKKIL